MRLARRIVLAIGGIMLTGAVAGGVSASPASYTSPLKNKCNEEIMKDAEWYRQLGHTFADQLLFDPRGTTAARPEVKLPEHEPGYTSPMRAQCTEELKKDGVWMAELRAYYDGMISYDFHRRNANSFVTNKQHVIGAYAVILVFLVGFVVLLFLRQRELVAEIERLRDDVERAAAE